MKKNIIAAMIVMALCLAFGIYNWFYFQEDIIAQGVLYAEADKIECEFYVKDLLTDEYPAELHINSLKEIRTEEGLKEVYSDVPYVAVVRVEEDFHMGKWWNVGNVRIVKLMKSDGKLQEGDNITITIGSGFSRKKGKKLKYTCTQWFNVPQKDNYYLMAFDHVCKKSLQKKMKKKNVMPPEIYTTVYTDVECGLFKLTKEENDFLVQKGETYNFADLKDVEFFCCNEEALKEWYLTKDAVLRYYVGDEYWRFSE